MWKRGAIPAELNVASIMSIFKKGETDDPANYRGISLGESLLKLLTSIVAHRLSSCVKLSVFQTGFRKSEEAAGQVATLLDICQRRQSAGLTSLVCFVDIKKAFDTVPHSALLYKCHLSGIRGRAFDFLRALYENPSAVVCSPEGLTGASFPIARGVRQGCPLSPILFDIYIDDLIPMLLSYCLGSRLR